MLRKFAICLCCCLLSVAWAQNKSTEQDLQALDQQIQALKEQISQTLIIENREEVDSQAWMIADWPKYSQEIESIQQQQNQAHMLQEQLKSLEARKAQLLQQMPSSKSSL